MPVANGRREDAAMQVCRFRARRGRDEAAHAAAPSLDGVGDTFAAVDQSFGVTAPLVAFSIAKIKRRDGVRSSCTYRLTATCVTPIFLANTACGIAWAERYFASFIPQPYHNGLSRQYQFGL